MDGGRRAATLRVSLASGTLLVWLLLLCVWLLQVCRHDALPFPSFSDRDWPGVSSASFLSFGRSCTAAESARRLHTVTASAHLVVRLVFAGTRGVESSTLLHRQTSPP